MARRVIILGAGISGLATAWFLKQRWKTEIEVTVLEKSAQVGGWMRTTHQEGFLFELGPRSCRTQGAGQETLALVEALGLQGEILTPSVHAHRRYLYQKSVGLQRLPQRWWEVPINSLTRGWASALWRDWHEPRAAASDESIQEFFSRRLGTAWFERLIDPFVTGIYAGDCRRLSLPSCFPLFSLWEKERGSLLRGAWHHRSSAESRSPFVKKMSRYPIFSFRRGMQTLPLALAQQLDGHLRLNSAVVAIAGEAEGVTVKLADGQLLRADYLVSTLPLFALEPLLGSALPCAVQLAELPYATVWVVNMGFDRPVLPLTGFGYLVPSSCASLVLGCVWDSAIFPAQNTAYEHTRLTIMLGGRRHPEVAQMAEQEVVASAVQALKCQMGIEVEPSVVQATRAFRAIPQYEVGYAAWKEQVEGAFQRCFPRLVLSGSGWTGVSINDGVANARRHSLNPL